MTEKTNRDGDLHGRVALITGASRGLGAALALELAKAGMKLVLASREGSRAELERVAEQARALGAETLAVSADVADRADVERLAAEALGRFGRVDLLVNNASTLGPLPLPLLLDTPVEGFRAALETNLFGPFLLTRALAGQMLARDAGLIINVTSDAAAVGYPHWGAYGVSKAALDQLTRVWAAELEGTGVGIAAIDPGSMNTVMHRDAEPDENPEEWADPAAIAPALALLARADPRRVNGRRFEAQDRAALAELRELAASGVQTETSHV
ncbi:MAG TPA: SDR family oxidoreductase [Dehalococcoidia bacterium]|nr:SDR family oxidoreductase [Dehalococcoidia bacterium]